MIYGAMLAGGVGSRMKSAVIPKQFLEVDGKPIIIYTLQNMLKVDRSLRLLAVDYARHTAR